MSERKSSKEGTQEGVETEETIQKLIEMKKDFAEALETEAEISGRSEDEVLRDWFFDEGFWAATLDAEESVIRLQYIDIGKADQLEVGEVGAESETNLKIFRDLREHFPPVTAGIDYLKAFVAGGGFTVGITNPDDNHQKEVRDEINKLNRRIYMDEMTKGLDALIDLFLEDGYTDGVAAAEIVYDKFYEPGSFDFNEYVEDTFEVIEKTKDGKEITKTRYRPKELTGKAWKDFKGVRQLKIVDNAYTRLKPYRDATTYQILYWTVDETQIETWNKQNEDKPPREFVKLMPWQILWFSPNRRGTKLKGVSVIKPVADTALLLKKILKDVGINFDKWADRKYFFILGSDKSGRSWAPPFIRNFLKNVKKLADKGGIGIPVPAGFDVKDIGGEVYDGGQILDKLISMIVGGMKYPRTFLEQGKTQEGDKSWLAWIVTYGKHQEQLRRTIENQLWARHLYCKFGLERKIPKQGVPQDQQAMEETYIPNMQWRSEGKWHRETKLKMLYGGLNVANPLGPEVKLEVEEDIARTLGYSEINFDPAREMLAINQKIEILERKMELIKAEMLNDVLEQAQKKKIHMKMLPVIKGLVSEEEEPSKKEGEKEEPLKRPPPVPGARQEGGVSRATKETGKPSQKGVAKPMKTKRTPGKAAEEVQETEVAEETEELEGTVEEVPSIDVAKILTDYATTLNTKDRKIKLVTPIPQPSEE